MNKKNAHRTEEQKRDMVKQVALMVENGQTAKEACKSLGVFSSQLYLWRRQFAGKPEGQARQIKPRNVNTEKQLLIENQRLKMIVADQALDIQALKEYNAR